MSVTWYNEQPSNLALIKYMGKQDAARNIPTHASLSYTLDDKRSAVELELLPKQAQKDCWEPLSAQHILPIILTSLQQQRFLKHLSLIKAHMGPQAALHHFKVRSGNTFPAHCGLASSASSFAALTQCAVNALCDITNQPKPPLNDIVTLSRMGSGSSCRSFFEPWTLWNNEKVERLQLPYQQLEHYIVLIESSTKTVSSSEAHHRVLSSLLYQGRAQRAQQRLELLTACLKQHAWQKAFLLIWQEFHDMHALFETCAQPFRYRNPSSEEVLQMVYRFWQEHNDGPWVSMDAGPNIHLLFRSESTLLRDLLLKQLTQAHFTIL